jgi:hypothetical protein
MNSIKTEKYVYFGLEYTLTLCFQHGSIKLKWLLWLQCSLQIQTFIFATTVGLVYTSTTKGYHM